MKVGGVLGGMSRESRKPYYRCAQRDGRGAPRHAALRACRNRLRPRL